MSRRLATLAGFCALALALMIPAGAGAVNDGQVSKLTTSYCKAQKKKVGKKAFTKQYGKKGMKSCAKRQRKAVQSAYRQAASDCQAELDEFGAEEFMLEWESFDECVQWYAEEYLNPSEPSDDPLDDEEEADPLV
jgi:hypothetical protein